jgi:hypothetical protein
MKLMEKKSYLVMVIYHGNNLVSQPAVAPFVQVHRIPKEIKIVLFKPISCVLGVWWRAPVGYHGYEMV